MTELERNAWVGLVLLAWCAQCWWSLRSARRQAHPPRSRQWGRQENYDSPFVLVAYASQSGTASHLAETSAALLHSPWPVRLLPLNRVDNQVLSQARQAFFVVSTYGEGEPPDNGIGFQNRYLRTDRSVDLSHLEYAVLALGDRTYQHFCAFGQQLHSGLEKLNAHSLAELVQLGREEIHHTEGDLHTHRDKLIRTWLGRLVELNDQSTSLGGPPSEAGSFRSCRLTARQQLNLGSPGAPLFYLKLELLEPNPVIYTWQAGDIAQIQPRNSAKRCEQWLQQQELNGEQIVNVGAADKSRKQTLRTWLADRQLPAEGPLTGCFAASSGPGLAVELPALLANFPCLPMREYSIASVPQERELHLIVRQQRTPDGTPGVGSGWLTAHAQLGDEMHLRVRQNPSFHAPAADCPMILVGSGSGVAGLRAHLAARAQQGGASSWLIYGERSCRHDYLLEDEIATWQASGVLTRVDRVFSREILAVGSGATTHTSRGYVQDVLRANAQELQRWLVGGAVLLVCGSHTGMGAGVEHALIRLLGEDTVAHLKSAGRYRRDLY